jgi:hypothetical protein
MHNPVPATDTSIAPDDRRPKTLRSSKARTRCAPVSTRPAPLAITTVTDELGRPLVGVFVPDSELL